MYIFVYQCKSWSYEFDILIRNTHHLILTPYESEEGTTPVSHRMVKLFEF